MPKLRQEENREGSNYIKLISDVPRPSRESLNVISEAAHERRKMVVVHASAYTQFDIALDANTDIITHAPQDKPVSIATTQQMVRNCVVSVPTLTMMQAVSTIPPLSAALGMIFNPSLFIGIQRSKRNSQGTQRLNECKGLGTCTAPVSLSSQAHTDCHDEPNSFFDVRHGESFTSNSSY